MKILIVGMGIGGATLAALLEKNPNVEVHTVEQSNNWSHVGFTIGIWDLGRRVLDHLGLAEEFDARGRRIQELIIADRSRDHILLRYNFSAFYDRYFSAYTHIGRKDLHELLLTRSHTPVRFGVSPVQIREDQRGVEVLFSDGTHAVYDLVVGADGLHSKVRELVFPDGRVIYTGKRAWFAWVPRKFAEPASIIEILGKNAMCNIFDDPQDACAVFVAPEPSTVSDDPETRIARLKKHFEGFGNPLPELIAGLEATALVPTDIGIVDVKHWVRGRVALLGDAAHAIEPFGGLGASMAMEDAYVLAEELGKNPIPKALAMYTERRMPRVRAARRQTRLLERWSTPSVPGMATIRNAALPYIPINYFTKEYERILGQRI